MFISIQPRVRKKSRCRPFSNRVWARLEELEPRSLLAVMPLTPANPPSGNTVAHQATFNAASQTPSGPFTIQNTGNQPGSNNPSAGQAGGFQNAAFAPPNTT